MKIALIAGLIIASLVVDLGGRPDAGRIRFRYWKHPGLFNAYHVEGNTGRFLAFWSSLISAAFSYENIQVLALPGTPEASKKIFCRVFFYVLSIFLVSLIV